MLLRQTFEFGMSFVNFQPETPILILRFPNQEDRKLQWLSSIGRENWVPYKSSKICSDHFKESDINRNKKIVVLKENAMPTRLKCAISLDKKKKRNKVAMKVIKLEEKVVKYKKNMKIKQQKVRRLKKKVANFEDIIKSLRKKNLITTNCEELLRDRFSGVPMELFKRTSGEGKGKKGTKYSPELRAFALTLQFYSTKAYNFVRKSFNLSLPHVVQIRRWYSEIPADPGFTEPAFRGLQERAATMTQQGKGLYCSLMMDEMTIKKHISWDGNKYRGYVDVGDGADGDDSLPVAREALVFMVVALNESWKVPIGYFLLDGMSGQERANLVRNCIKKLTAVGVITVSLTCDGPSCNMKMLSELGANLSPENLRPHFPYPMKQGQRIYVFLDVCHMLKLIRNTLGQTGPLTDIDGNKISWEYIYLLDKVQREEGLRLGNKLTSAHIQFWQQKMKVKLAAQALSGRVASAIDFLNKELQRKEFQGSEATVKFIRLDLISESICLSQIRLV